MFSLSHYKNNLLLLWNIM